MSERDLIPLYDGALQANQVGRFARGGATFDIIRPGYDAQGRRRTTWTQFVFEGVPVFEVKRKVNLDVAMEIFDELWAEHIKDEHDLLLQALNSTRKDRLSKFRDGRTGESPAPALTVDGREEGKRYTA